MYRTYLIALIAILGISKDGFAFDAVKVDCTETQTVEKLDLMTYAFAIKSKLDILPPVPIKKTKAVIPGCVIIDSLFTKAKTQNKSSITLLLQFGFFDDPQDPKALISSDYDISENFIEFLSYCDFNSVAAESTRTHTVFRKVKKAGEVEEKTLNIVLGKASKDGNFDESFSKDSRINFDAIKARSNYLITLGHSRYGNGLDLYPYRFQYKNVIPVYSDAFLNSLPNDLVGMAILGCDSQKYLKTKTRKINSTRQIIDVQGPFYSSNGVKQIFQSIQDFQ